MRTLLQRKWVVAVCAIALTLAIGAVAWAATGAPGGGAGGATCAGPAECAGDCPEAGGAWMGDAAGGRGQRGAMGMGALRGDSDSEGIRQHMRERRDEMTKCGGEALDRVRERMSAEDQAKLDGLLDTARSQRDELRKAGEALRGTVQQIRDLVRQHLPADEAGSGGA